MENPESSSEIREIEETSSNSEQQSLLQHRNPRSNSITVKRKVPEVEIHLYRQGKGPIDVFKSNLGGWGQDQIEVREILDKYGFKSVFAFKPDSGRGVPIRFSPKNGRSILTYRDGAEIFIDGEPKVEWYTRFCEARRRTPLDVLVCNLPIWCLQSRCKNRQQDSLIKPVTRIVFGVAIISIMITLLSTSKDSQGWMKKLNITGNFPPWILACVVIVFTRSRKRTKDLLKKFGW